MFVGIRTFTSANGVFPETNYFLEPDDVVNCLTELIIEGKFCLLHGHRQSGKTTIIHALVQHLQTISNTVSVKGFPIGLEVYTISFNAGLDVVNGVDRFWGSLCRKMRAGYPSRFPVGENADSSTFQERFLRARESKPVVLLIDEGSFLVNSDKLIVDDFIGMLRLLRDNRREYCMHSVVLVGVETIKELLVPRQLPGSVGRISPFTREATIVSGHFTEADIKTLLDEYCEEASIQLDSADFARDIYQRTIGHKGLVGTCCAALEKNVIPGKSSVSISDWELYAVANLVRNIRQQDTYASIVRSLKNLKEKHRNIIGLVLRHGSAIIEDCDELRFLLAEGIIIVQEKVELFDPGKKIAECAAPLLRSIMISQLTGPDINIGWRPEPPVCAKWLIARTIENLAIQHIFAKETRNANGQPSEYALQMEVVAIFKQLLSQAYPTLGYHVLPEAKECDENGRRRQRLDILVRDGKEPAYGFELLVEANKSVFNDHYQRSAHYGQIHGCSMIMMHFTSGKLCSYFGPGGKSVTVMHVIYGSSDKREAKLVYENGEETVDIKGADWQVMFE